VRGFFSSPRRRRRTFVAGVALVLVGAITFSMIHWSNTSDFKMAKVRYNEKAQVYTPPVARDYRKAKREGALTVAAKFVNTAVKRKHVADSFDLTTPTLHTGYTRKAWATEDIPVVPYPVDFAKYQVKGSFTDSVWYQVAVFPDHAHANVPAAVYDLVLKPSGSGASRHWLVDSWAPAGYEGIPSAPLGSASSARSASREVVEYKGAISGRWLFAPVSAFGLGLVLLAALGARGWWRNNRAVKRYKSTYL
jgi:hypothetical protein